MRLIFTTVAILASSLSFSQERIIKTKPKAAYKETIKTNPDGSRTITKKLETPTEKTFTEVKPQKAEMTLEQIDTRIKSYQTKIEAVKNNPEEHQKALANGWYDKINAQIVELNKLKASKS